MASDLPSTSASSLPIRQPQKPVSRIAQPPNSQQQQQNHYASFKAKPYHHYQNFASITNGNSFTTTFHANAADGMTTILPLQSNNNLVQQHHFSGITQKQPSYTQHSDERIIPPLTILSGSTAFSSTSNSGILHYNSAPTLPIHRLLSQQQKPSTSSLNPELQSNSLLRNKRVFSTQSLFESSNMRFDFN